MLNKLDKLIALEPSDGACYRRLEAIVQELNALLAQGGGARGGAPRLDLWSRGVVFGRGSLSVAETVGGWGFTLEGFLRTHAERQGWDDERLRQTHARLRAAPEKGFCALVLQPLRRTFVALDSGDDDYGILGVGPPAGVTGNARKHAAVEACFPLADTLLHSLVEVVPPPAALPPRNGCVFYSTAAALSVDGRSSFAIGRAVAAEHVRPLPDAGVVAQASPDGGAWLLNGEVAATLPGADAMGGLVVGVRVHFRRRG
eukprot:1520965-Prymnesium_polylepis.1